MHEGGLGPGPGRQRGCWGTPAPVTEAVCAAAVGPCPANQVYQECGEACIKTCSNPQHTCSSFCTFGCFCPKGEGSRSPWDPRNSTPPDSNTLEQGLTCPREGKGSPPNPCRQGSGMVSPGVQEIARKTRDWIQPGLARGVGTPAQGARSCRCEWGWWAGI